MPNAILVKNIGGTANLVLSKKALAEYPSESKGCSTNLGNGTNEVQLHFTGTPDLAIANQLLADIEKPTCVASLLQIITNVGQFVVNDISNIVADPTNEKFVKASVCIDDTTKDLEILIFEKITQEYGNPPAGKTFVVDLKEFSLSAVGTALILVKDFIS